MVGEYTKSGICCIINHMDECIWEKDSCCGCGACRDACYSGAICMMQDKAGFFYPRVNEKKCIKCGKCKQVCPLLNRSEGSAQNLYFGVQAKNDKIRYESTSGGIFPILAEYVFRRQGVVYGAAFNQDMEVVHTEAFDVEQLKSLKKTKYVQSNLDTVYLRIASWLKKERWVLFCGTPCQAHALKLFLKKQPCESERLIIVSLVCYGVPSPGIWNSYIKYLERRHGGKVTGFSFRDKRNKDNGHTCSYLINNTEYTTSSYNNIYSKIYYAGYSLRPSCLKCKFCTVERDSDFTIGDFWGIERINPTMDDGMGTSMVILHTEKARRIWISVRDELHWFECRKEEILQPRLIEPTAAVPGRRFFVTLYRVLPFLVLMKLVIGMVGLRGLLK